MSSSGVGRQLVDRMLEHPSQKRHFKKVQRVGGEEGVGAGGM